MNKTQNQRFLTCPLLEGKANKKAVSVLIGYVLLIAGIIVVSGVVYIWLRSYVPRPSIECPEGVSLFIEDMNCEGSNLNLSIRNNGRFEVNGYFIKATTTETLGFTGRKEGIAAQSVVLLKK